MFGLERLETVYVVWAFLFQGILTLHFALRKRAFDSYTRRVGWIVYAMSIPAFVISLFLLAGGMPWSLWIGGVLYLGWAIYGYWIEYVRKVRWRNPPRWPVLVPYGSLYLAIVMFYWWPLGELSRTLWYLGALLFVIGTVLNLTSHRSSEDLRQVA